MEEITLTAEQQAEAERIEDILKAQAAVEIRRIARLLASKDDQGLLGATEFQVRDAVHRIGARGIDAALSERKKGVPRVKHKLSALRAGRPLRRVSPDQAQVSVGPDRL